MLKKSLSIGIIVLCISSLQACSSVPDVPYHAICKDQKVCSDELLERAVSVRSNLFIKPNGWGSCFLDPTPPLSGSENLLESSICPKNATETRNQTEFQQAWIEYAEDGTPHDIWQKAAILHWIKNHKGPLHVLVYVHGWHNNADDLSNRDPRNNAIKFAFMASRHVDTLKRLHITNKIQQTDVLAIYVGWPGEIYASNPLLSLLSINSRSKVADRIGDPAGHFKRDLLEISSSLSESKGSQGHIFVMGHSLGGRILANAFMPDLAKGNIYPLGHKSLIVTVNAAVGADCYDPIFGPQGVNPSADRPYWINLTSENDDATKITYKYAKQFGLVDSCNAQSPAAKMTVGHYGPYLRQFLDNARNISTNTISTFEDTKEIAVNSSEFSWFRKSGILRVTFPYRENNNLNYQKTDQYLIDFGPQQKTDESRLSDAIWNVRSDQSLIDFDIGGGGINGRHNGFITTIPSRLLLEILYK